MSSVASSLKNAKCWHNGKIIPAAEAKLSVFDHGVLYGDGMFEGLRFYGRKPFKLRRHLERLAQSARALDLNLPYKNDILSSAIFELIDGSGLEEGYLRILVTRGEGSLGLNPQHCERANVFILLAEMELLSKERQAVGLNLITSSVKRTTGSGLDSRVKSLNYLHSILAKAEANNAGADDALLLNQHGLVAECSAANIFIVVGKRLLTPPCTDGALEGITRETVIELAKELGLEVELRSLSPWDIYNADECFITGSAARLMSIASLDGRRIAQVNGSVFSSLNKAFLARVREHQQ